MIASPEDGMYLNISNPTVPKEFNTNEHFGVSSVKDIIYDAEE